MMRAGRGFRNNLLHVSRSGGVDAVFGTIGLFEPDVGSGKVEALAVLANTSVAGRSLWETISGFEVKTWFGRS